VRDRVTANPLNQTVLIIEDDPAIGNMLMTLLGIEGYQPVLKSDGQAGLDAARELHPAIITLDLSLPTIDGMQVLDQLDDRSGHRIPVIIVSAYTDTLTSAHRARVSAILTKPFEIDTLLRCIGTALGHT
jgi:DNA-binding response OmpR family regulator